MFEIWSANGPFEKMIKSAYMVVPKAIKPSMGTAQNWYLPFQIHLVVFFSWNEYPYKILSESVEKYGSYVYICSAVVAHEICPIMAK